MQTLPRKPLPGPPALLCAAFLLCAMLSWGCLAILIHSDAAGAQPVHGAGGKGRRLEGAGRRRLAAHGGPDGLAPVCKPVPKVRLLCTARVCTFLYFFYKGTLQTCSTGVSPLVGTFPIFDLKVSYSPYFMRYNLGQVPTLALQPFVCCTCRIFSGCRSENIAQAMVVRGFQGPNNHRLFLMSANVTTWQANAVALILLCLLAVLTAQHR